MTENDEMAVWHHRLNGREFEQIPEDGEVQGNLACCGQWGHQQSVTTEQLINKSIFKIGSDPDSPLSAKEEEEFD